MRVNKRKRLIDSPFQKLIPIVKDVAVGIVVVVAGLIRRAGRVTATATAPVRAAASFQESTETDDDEDGDGDE